MSAKFPMIGILFPSASTVSPAPSAEAVGILGSAESAARYIKNDAPPKPYAVMCFTDEETYFEADVVIPYGHRGAAEEQGEKLFEILRELDEKELKRIYINAERTDGVGLAVFNRLLRSCGFKMIRM